MAKHKAEESSSFKKAVITLVTLILILSTVLFIEVKMTEYLENKSQKEISKILDTIDIPEIDIDPNVSAEVTERMLKIKELQKQNLEIVGWLEIDGTNINYPVLQGKDNDYYLKHNYKYEYISTGSIFLDKDYDWIKPSENLLIYGHRNRVGLMFDELIKYKDESFYKKHNKIRFTTATEDAEYEVMSAFKSRVYYQDEKNVFRYYKFVNAEDENAYNKFVSNAKDASLYDTGVNAIYGDQLMTLSTCDNEVENGRFAVVAVKITNNTRDD